MNVAVVIPTIRPDRFMQFAELWENELRGKDVIIVEDNPERSFQVLDWQHYAWKEIDEDLGESARVVPRRNSGIRVYGFLQAWRQGADIVVTLDDDVSPHGYTIDGHVARLSTPQQQYAWAWTADKRTRGLPYANLHRELSTVISHGTWLGCPDQDAVSQLYQPQVGFEGFYKDKAIPSGSYYPMCWMNLAFRREILPAMLPPPMGQGQPFDRFDDIWAGIVSKKICDHLGLGVWSGSPFVHHNRASDPFDNLIKEATGIKENERFWKIIDGVRLTKTNVQDCMAEVAQQLPEEPYYQTLGEIILEWLELLK